MLIAGFYAGLAGLLVVALAIRVMWLRNTRRVGLGTGSDPALTRAIRAHANAVEYVPLALLLLVLLALQGSPARQLHLFGIVLIVARVLHAIGLSSNPGRSFGRVVGAGLTVLLILAMTVLLVWRFVAG